MVTIARAANFLRRGLFLSLRPRDDSGGRSAIASFEIASFQIDFQSFLTLVL
jgi:hypothetical protein